MSFIMGRLITKGSSSGSTLSLALRSKGEAGQPSYLIIQAIAVHFRTPPLPPPPPPRTLRADPKRCNLQCFCAFGMEKVLYFLQHSENCVNTCAFARHWQQKHCKYRDFCYRGKQKTNIVNTVVLGFRGAKNISQYLRCFFWFRELPKKKT